MNLSNHITRYLSDETQSACAAKDDGKQGVGHPLMPDDKETRRHVHAALAGVHKAVFQNDKHDTLDKAKRAHALLVDAAKPDDDDNSKKAGTA